MFSALAAIINYELDATMYTTAAPAVFIGLTVLTAAIPYIVSAVLSFTVAYISANASESDTEKIPELPTQQKSDAEETPP